MEEKVSILELYLFLKSGLRKLPGLFSKIQNCSHIDFFKPHKYDKNLSYILSKVTIQKDIQAKLIFNFEYKKNLDIKYNYSYEYVKETIEVTLDDNNNLNFKSISIENHINDLDYLPISRISSFSSIKKIFKIDIIKDILNMANNLKPSMKFNLSIHDSYPYINQCVAGMVIDGERRTDSKITFIFKIYKGDIHLCYDYRISEKRTSSSDDFYRELPDKDIDAYLKGNIHYINRYFHYDEILDVASKTYIYLNELPENIRGYISEYLKQEESVDETKRKILIKQV